jgi:hypothetical protein
LTAEGYNLKMFRPDKKQKVILITVLGLVLMAATIPAAIWITHTQSAEVGHARLKCQKGQQVSHKVVIQNDQVEPKNTSGRLCDTLTITNLDSQDRLMAFGRHENHISYDGVSERIVGQGQSLTVTMVKRGNYLFHDHENEAVRGTFTVKD